MIDLTNADRIRTMSDEELAVAFAKLNDRIVFTRMVQSYSGRAANDWLDWLKSPAEGAG